MSVRSFWVLAAAVLVAGLASASASGYSYSVSSPVPVSGPSPFSGCSFGAAGSGVVYTNA